MINEISLRALINNNLKCEEHNVSPSSIGFDETINLIERPFETDKKWNKKNKINYIESIFLNCSLQPIIRFKNNNHTVIVDGYNRFNTIKSFYNNEFKLDEKGLDQLKFLANKNYEKLSKNDNQKNYFNRNACIKILDYSCEVKQDDNRSLTEEEEFEVLRYLYTIYNTGLRLEVEEIQKAQYYDDYITTKLRNKIAENEQFLELLENLRLYNGRKKKNKIDNILLNCRLLISSTYSNIHNFSYAPDVQTRIEENYLPNIDNLNKNLIFEDFIININQIFNCLINTQKWEKYPKLHSKPFIEATYWLISIIRKDDLINPLSFDFMKYLEFFGEREEVENNFDIYHAHYSKFIYKKFFVVATYFQNEYNIKMDSYFKELEQKNNKTKVIKNFDELYNRDFNFTPAKIQISNLLIQLNNSSYNLRPHYQRCEIMNSTLSSRIVESILLGIRIPYILTCDKIVSRNYITEVVDGQQRLLSILGFLESPFMNESGELEYSNKNGYSLKGLRVLSELNNLSFKNKKSEKLLPIAYVNKILNSYLYIYKTKDLGNNCFNTIDYFVRLNKNASLIKENSYRMLNLTCDRKIMEYCDICILNFLEKLLPKKNKNGKPNIIILRLSYLFYNKLYNDINFSNYSNIKVANWLNDFNKYKDKNIFINQENISKLRLKYCSAINDAKKFLIKLEHFLNTLNNTFIDLICINNISHIPLSYYYYLFCFLCEISEDSLISNNEKIYSIIKEFFSKIKSSNMTSKEILCLLKFYVKQIQIFI